MNNTKTVRFHLEGLVQGVGMRYFIYRSAKHKGLSGYVKNKGDGSVEGVLQGSDGTVDQFLTYIKEHSPGDITNVSSKMIDNDTKYENFEITF